MNGRSFDRLRTNERQAQDEREIVGSRFRGNDGGDLESEVVVIGVEVGIRWGRRGMGS